MTTNNNNDGAPMYVVGLQLIGTIDVWMNTNDGFTYVDAIRIHYSLHMEPFKHFTGINTYGKYVHFIPGVYLSSCMFILSFKAKQKSGYTPSRDNKS